MNKWADYLISSVSYTPERLILGVIRHKDTEKGITKGEQVDRITLTSDIKHGLSYVTIYSGQDSWKKGNKLKIFSIDGDYYLRIDQNKVKLDFLGDIPEIPSKQSNADKEILPKQTSESKQLESKPSPAKPSDVTKPKGALPKQSSDELPQELDLAPEPMTESDEATPEQLQRLEQLEKQIKTLSRKVSPKKPRSKKLKK